MKKRAWWKIWDFLYKNFFKPLQSISKKETKIGLLAIIIAIIGYPVVKRHEYNLYDILALMALFILGKELLVNLRRQYQFKFDLSKIRLLNKRKAKK